ncbi:hypothetical protein GOBAR_DD06111 [Gossypium barbadense]|nr:hypothetical protein GOBAR_DD06111 [Gossypium barbadense]
MRFNRNVPVDDVKKRINAKIVTRYGMRMSKLFYKFLISSNHIKYTKMELVDDEDVGTMVAFYCRIGSVNIESIQFAKLANVELVEDSTQLSEEYGVQDPCTKVLIASVNRRSSVCRFDIDLNAPPVSENLNLGPHLQIYLVLIETDTDGQDEYDNNGCFDHEVEDYSDPDLDDVLNDIDDECANDDGNVYAYLVGNPSRDIVICNDPGDHMSNVNLDMAHASEFPKYLDILPAHLLATALK